MKNNVQHFAPTRGFLRYVKNGWIFNGLMEISICLSIYLFFNFFFLQKSYLLKLQWTDDWLEATTSRQSDRTDNGKCSNGSLSTPQTLTETVNKTPRLVCLYTFSLYFQRYFLPIDTNIHDWSCKTNTSTKVKVDHVESPKIRLVTGMGGAAAGGWGGWHQQS